MWRILPSVCAATVVAIVSSCARQQGPSGGPEDRRPPGVIATTPAPFEVVEDLNTKIRFDFDERISERVSGGLLDDLISISPRGGAVKVRHARRSLTLEIEGGLKPGIVYRVTLRDAVNDMFGNALADPFELIFSTGGEAVPTTLAGQVWDRVTGAGVPDAKVVAIGPDSLVHLSGTNSEGIFAFRYLPGGAFVVTAFLDNNRDGDVDSTEVQGAAPTRLEVGDTVLMDLPVLAPDTSAASLTGASAVDSTTVVLVFNDFLDPNSPATDVGVTLALDSAAAPSVLRVLHEAEYAAFVDFVTDSFARLDSIDAAEVAQAAAAAARLAAAADSIAAPEGDSTAVEVRDSTAVPQVGARPVTPAVRRDSAGVRLPAGPGSVRSGRVPPPRLAPLAGTRPGPTPDGRRVLPARRLVALLAERLGFDVEYEVSASGVVNISGVSGGGGLTPLTMASPPVDTVAVDTLAVDTLVAVPDTGVVDTLSLVDNGGVLRRPSWRPTRR